MALICRFVSWLVEGIPRVVVVKYFFSSGRRFNLCIGLYVCSADREVAVTETVTFQIEFERSKACVNAIE